MYAEPRHWLSRYCLYGHCPLPVQCVSLSVCMCTWTCVYIVIDQLQLWPSLMPAMHIPLSQCMWPTQYTFNIPAGEGVWVGPCSLHSILNCRHRALCWRGIYAKLCYLCYTPHILSFCQSIVSTTWSDSHNSLPQRLNAPRGVIGYSYYGCMIKPYIHQRWARSSCESWSFHLLVGVV